MSLTVSGRPLPGEGVLAVEEALQVGATVGERRAGSSTTVGEVALVDRLDGAVEVQQQGVDAQRVRVSLRGITSPSASTSPALGARLEVEVLLADGRAVLDHRDGVLGDLHAAADPGIDDDTVVTEPEPLHATDLHAR